MKRKTREVALRLIPLLLFLVVWEMAVHGSQKRTFLFGSPTLVWKTLWAAWMKGDIIGDIGITTAEAVVGFILGNVLGVILGLVLSYFRRISSLAKPYIVALGAIPIFALAPMMIIWFGVGFLSKVMMAVFSTFLITTIQAFSGADEVNRELRVLFRAFGATRREFYRKAIIPSSVSWVIASLKITIGFALLGAFIGEFVSSDRGLGHLILKAGGLYDIPMVLVGILHIVLIALALSAVVARIEKRVLWWKYRVAAADAHHPSDV